MFDVVRFFISNAYAQPGPLGVVAPQDSATSYVKYLPLALVALIIYFLFMHKKKG